MYLLLFCFLYFRWCICYCIDCCFRCYIHYYFGWCICCCFRYCICCCLTRCNYPLVVIFVCSGQQLNNEISNIEHCRSYDRSKCNYPVKSSFIDGLKDLTV